MKRRTTNVFSLSFIDCICCGLGAIILLFVIVNAKSAAYRNQITAEMQAEVDKAAREVLEGRKKLVDLRNALEMADQQLARTDGESRRIIPLLRQRETELAHNREDNLARRQHLDKLKADLRAADEGRRRLEGGGARLDERGDRVRSFPGQGDRLYLTDLKVGGKYILILLDTSASMLDESIVGIIRRRNLAESQRRQAPKWQRTLATVEWLAAQLPPDSRYQVMTFNEQAQALLPGTAGQWLPVSDGRQLDVALQALRQLVPANGTSLINALQAAARLTPLPDNIYLLTDGLPTRGADAPWRGKVSGTKRMRLFNEALAQRPPGVPINIILFPLEGDPDAASAYWRMAVLSRGSFFCPAADWP